LRLGEINLLRDTDPPPAIHFSNVVGPLYAGCNEALDDDGVFDGCLFLSQSRQGAEAQSYF